MSKSITPLMTAIRANVPVVIIGEPGTAKTARIEREIAPALQMRCETVIASIRDVTDLGGLPVVTSDGVTLAPPGFAKRIINNDQPTLLFFDEISTAPPACQAGVLRIINERWVGDTKLPDSCRIIAAMNPPATSAGGGELTAPLANRFCHIPWTVDVNEWVAWAVQRSQSHVRIAGYIRTKPHGLLAVPKNESELGKPWPSPRTWDMAGRLMDVNEQHGGTLDDALMLIAGCVGEGNALEYINYQKNQDLPDIEFLIANPEKYEVPERGDIAFTILAGIAQAVCAKMTKPRYLAALQMFLTTAQAKKKDIAASCILPVMKMGVAQPWAKDADVVKALTPVLKPFTDLFVQAGIIAKS